MKLNIHFSFTVIAIIALATMAASCGGGGSSGISSFSQLPDASAMVSTSTSSTAFSRAAVSGTAPLITALPDDADQYFWNGLVGTINDADAATEEQARQFWGGQSGGPSGQGGCMMAQNTAQVFGRLLESGTSTCYMKSMPDAASGVTITPTPDGGNSAIFNQQAADRLVRVDVSNEPSEGEGEEGGGGGQQVFIKVFGSNTVTSDVYKVQLYFCREGSVDGYEIFEVNKSTMAYTGTSVHQEGDSNSFSSSLTGKLKAGSGDALQFDTDEDRLVTMKGSFSGDSFSAKISITGDDLIYSLMNHSHSQGGHTFSNKTSSVASFSGDSINTVRFLAAAFKGEQTASGGEHISGDFSHSFEGALEWQDSYYASIATGESTLYSSTTELSDSFFSESRTPSVDFAGISCDATPDFVVAMDFADSNVLAIKTGCEGDRIDGDSNNYCWGGEVQEAQQYVQTRCQSGC